MVFKRALCALVFLFTVVTASAQVANGKLQIHQIDMGQGDGGVLITPNGTVVLFDAGLDIAKQKTCSAVDVVVLTVSPLCEDGVRH